MNALPEIGSPAMRKGFWYRHGHRHGHLHSEKKCHKGVCGEKFFWHPKKRFLKRFQRFFAAVL